MVSKLRIVTKRELCRTIITVLFILGIACTPSARAEDPPSLDLGGHGYLGRTAEGFQVWEEEAGVHCFLLHGYYNTPVMSCVKVN